MTDILTNENGVTRNPGRLVRQLFNHAPDALVVVDDQDKIVLINTRAEQLFGFSSALLAGQSPRKLLPAWFESLAGATKDNPLDGFENVCNMPAIRQNGIKFSAEVSLSTLIIGSHQFMVAGVRDTTPNSLALRALEHVNRKLEESNKQLEGLCKTDPLTELLNRRGLEHVLQREISYSQRNKTDLLAILVDLDDFKSINDINGHATGDRVLRQAAQTIQNSLRSVDWIARVGGDEFLILLPSTPLSTGAQVAERVRLALCQNLTMGNDEKPCVTASMGLVSLPEISTLEQVLEMTAAALKESKSKGKNRVTFGDNGLVVLNAESQILSELLQDSGSCRVVQRGILDLQDNKLVAHELLSMGPPGLLEKPDALFRVALRNDLLAVVDLHCLKLCLAHAKAMPDNTMKTIHLFASTLIDVATCQLIELIQSFEIKGDICIEFTEHRVTEKAPCLKEQVRELRAAGIMICLNGIGTGGTTLESIISLEPEFVRLACESVRGVAHDWHLRRNLSKLTRLTHSVGTKSIADGIETKEDYIVAKELGINFGQGLYWA